MSMLGNKCAEAGDAVGMARIDPAFRWYGHSVVCEVYELVNVTEAAMAFEAAQVDPICIVIVTTHHIMAH